MNAAAIRKRLVRDGWSVLSGGFGPARFSLYRDGQTEYRDADGEPVDVEIVEDEPESADRPSTLADEACELVRMDEGTMARVLMGRQIDKATLERLIDSGITIEDALNEYVSADIKTWLKRSGIETASNQKPQLISLAVELLAPEPEPEVAVEPDPPAEPEVVVDAEITTEPTTEQEPDDDQG